MTIRKTIVILSAAVVACMAVSCGNADNNSVQELKAGFQNPPKSARPYVWWHWMDGNISMDGVRKDLLWMDKVGLGGLHQFDAGGRNMEKIVPEKIYYLTPQWKEVFRSALNIADSLGLEVSVASCPGWSSTGGPWVKPEQAMKKLVWRTMEVDGGKNLDVVLPEPFTEVGKYQNLPLGASADDVPRYYTDVAVVAVKIPAGTGVIKGGKITSSGGDFSGGMLCDEDFSREVLLPRGKDGIAWIQYTFDEPVTVRALTLSGESLRTRYYADPASSHYKLQAGDDGIVFKDVCEIPDGVIPVMTIDVPATTARCFRLVAANPDASAAGRPVREFALYDVSRINHSEEKAGFSAPHDVAAFATPADADAIATSDVVVLTDKVKDGRLTWNAPDGHWKIFRFGASLTGKKNHPAAADATGLEVDKLDPDAWLDYFHNFMDMYKEAAGGNIGKSGIQYILTDSYEAEQITWTPTMEKVFSSRRGYELAPWLPVLTGEIVGSAGESEKFLWDWRQTIGELFAENYDRINDITREYGLQGRYTESHENGHVYVGDGMAVKATAAVPMSAIWTDDSMTGSRIPMARADIRESASVAHIYGQNLVAAESFTANGYNGRAYIYVPENLKNTADIALSSGLNRFVIHDSAHQPSDDHIPGTGLFQFGQWFNRHETWAGYANFWVDYLARSCYMLQQGRAVADVLVYYGEDNSVTGLYGHELPPVPYGYEFDFINPDGLIGAVTPKDGKLVTDSGMSYSVLWLGENCASTSVRMLRRIAEIAQAGVPVCGTIPSECPSKGDDPEEFKSLVDKIWHSGLKNVYTGSLEDVLAGEIGLTPDFLSDDKEHITYLHRLLPDGTDIYWVRNFSPDARKVNISFRTVNHRAEVFHPETGISEPIATFKSYRNTFVDLPLESQDAVFVVLTKGPSYEVPKPLAETEASTVSGPWTVRFQPGRGAPESSEFRELKSFSENADPGIRYFSGTASYTNSISLTEEDLADSEGWTLDLGSVKNLAEVIINGRSLGVVWKAPFKVSIPKSVFAEGDNLLEIKVTNTWVNRVIGDAAPGVKNRMTFTPVKFYDADSKLVPSGLLGPVKLYRKTIQ